MGMFDRVQCEAMRCPQCGNPDMDWQTKDANCVLETVYVQNIMLSKNFMRMIGGCEDCRNTVEVIIKRDLHYTPRQHIQLMKEKKTVMEEK